MIGAQMTSELGGQLSTRPFKKPLLCKWSTDPAIMTSCGSMFITLCLLIAISTACPQSKLGAARKITSGHKSERGVYR